MLYLKSILYLVHGLKVTYIQSNKNKGEKVDADKYI